MTRAAGVGPPLHGKTRERSKYGSRATARTEWKVTMNRDNVGATEATAQIGRWAPRHL
jgi:hypothetical protein